MLGIAIDNRLAVLMARIVDQAGIVVQPCLVASISYTLLELDARDKPKPVRGRVAVPLDVDVVMYDSLQTDDLWSLDVSGYNFRHEFEFPPAKRKSGVTRNYVAVYEFVSMDGLSNIISFQLKGISR